MMRLVPVLCLLLAGCTVHYLEDPLVVSTRSLDSAHVTALGPVSVERCDQVFLTYVPLLKSEPKAMSALLTAAREEGGNAVMDVQIRETDSIGLFLLYWSFCWEASGTAIRIE